ncbi:MAG: hypothetical protein NVS9B9_30730 [Ktedonobacteraceae bacterium]
MSKQFIGTNEQMPPRSHDNAVTYSARIQDVMRYNKLYSSDYPLVMTILRAVAQGHTEERWQEEQQRTLKILAAQPPYQGRAHADAANRYDQIIHGLQDLMLWPW